MIRYGGHATPHIAGVVALLNSLHPDWSPDAMKSALIHLESQSLLKGQSRRLRIHFYYGGGLVNPNKAANPSLIYDISTNDYISYLCAFG
ncbi:hypothetical protein ACFX15_037862 [Malus domestica]